MLRLPRASAHREEKTGGNGGINMKKHKGISYAKWGYLFILPFFVVYLIFSFTEFLMMTL